MCGSTNRFRSGCRVLWRYYSHVAERVRALRFSGTVCREIMSLALAKTQVNCSLSLVTTAGEGFQQLTDSLRAIVRRKTHLKSRRHPKIAQVEKTATPNQVKFARSQTGSGRAKPRWKRVARGGASRGISRMAIAGARALRLRTGGKREKREPACRVTAKRERETKRSSVPARKLHSPPLLGICQR